MDDETPKTKSSSTDTKDKKISEMIGELETKVERLRGAGEDLDLEDSIRLYKESMELAQRCEKKLKSARLEIDKINARAETDDIDTGADADPVDK